MARNPFKLWDDLMEAMSRRIISTALLTAVLSWMLAFVGAGLFKVAFVSFGGSVDALVQTADGDLARRTVELANIRDKDGQVTVREVGYLAAVNWSLYGGLLLPLVLAFCLRTRATMEPTLRALAGLKMIRDERFEPLSGDVLVERWRVDRARFSHVPGLVAGLVILFVGVDFYQTVASPILFGLPPDALDLQSKTYEYDWSVACLMAGEVKRSCAGNLAFDVAVYLPIAMLGSAIAFSAMVSAVLFIAFVCGVLQSRPAVGPDGQPLPTAWKLVASPKAKDPLCGFDAFEDFFSALLCAALVLLPSLLLIIFQNTYLRSADAANITAFFASDWEAMTASVVKHFKEGDYLAIVGDLFRSDRDIFLFNPNTGAAIFIFLFVVLASLMASWAVLRNVASDSRDLALQHLDKVAADFGLTERQAEKRLKGMNFWPVGWLSLNQAIFLVAFMALSLVSYRLILLPVILGMIILVARLMKSSRALVEADDD